jgi:hypothetical protein
MAKRKMIQERRLVSGEEIAAWFSYKPVSKPAPKKAVFEVRASAKPPDRQVLMFANAHRHPRNARDPGALRRF